MRNGWLRGAALVLAVGLGTSSGLAFSRVLDDDPDPGRDPLGIGAELLNQPCSGDNIIVVGRGENRPVLRAAVVESAGEARYLDTDASCPTLYATLDKAVPKYVVYLGPFSTPGEACALRMTPEHRGDFVTGLRTGNQTYVKCPCELATDGWPVLTPGMGSPDALEGMWTKQLQKMLVDTGRLRDDADESGVYDATTVAVVRRIQANQQLTPDGIVDAQTWSIIRDRACRFYDY